MKKSKFVQSLVTKKWEELTHFEWYWAALGFVKNHPQVSAATITYSRTCGCCKQTVTRIKAVKIHGDHQRAIDVARTLFTVGRPGVRPEEIEKVSVKSYDCQLTDITRTPKGKIEIGHTLMSGSIAELVRVGFLTQGGEPAKAA